MTELLDTVLSLIETNWNPDNAGFRTPIIFGKKHDYKQVPMDEGDCVTAYYHADEQKTVSGFGYHSVDLAGFVTVDVWTCFSDAQSILMRDEVERILMGERKSSATTGREIIDPPLIRDFRDMMRGNYRWALEFKLTKYNKAVVT